jgi:hypothetical protein
MKKISLNMEVDPYMERAVKNFCRENGLSVEKFIEEAIFEKLEAEELETGSFLTGETDDASGNNVSESMLYDPDGDFYKKKH